MLHNDSALKPGSNTWTIWSDRQLKHNIQPLGDALGRLLALRGVTFDWRDPATMGGRTGTEIGLLADQVQTIFPDWIGHDEQGYQTLTISGFEALTVEALRTLRAEKGCGNRDTPRRAGCKTGETGCRARIPPTGNPGTQGHFPPAHDRERRVKVMSRQGMVVTIAACFGGLVTCPAAQAQPLAMTFSYQGQLKDGGGPADGPHDFEFSLEDDPLAGTQIGPTLVFDGVGGNPPPIAVTEGLFTVELDFGPDAFTGRARCLEITVNGTPLVPRQRVSPAPYALALPGQLQNIHERSCKNPLKTPASA